MKKENILVSIIVVTYNSERFVLETLESIYNQTYKNIELVITDDCSTDNTITVCREWLKKKAKRFTRTQLVITEKNSGISANCNRGVKAATGEWLKLIAGDDALYLNSTQLVVDYVLANDQIKVFTSKSNLYNKVFDEKEIIEITFYSKNLDFFKLSSKQQYYSLLRENLVDDAGVYIKKDLIEEMGGFDERYRFIEDYPMWLKITRSGYRFFYLDELTAKYRFNEGSITSVKGKDAMFSNFYIKMRDFQKEYILPNVGFLERFVLNYEYYRHYIIDWLGLNRNNSFGKSIYYVTTKISPKRFSKKALQKKIKQNIIEN